MIHPKTKLIATLVESEPALASAVEGMSIYRAARADARLLHRVLPILLELADELRVTSVHRGHIPALVAFDALIRKDH